MTTEKVSALKMSDHVADILENGYHDGNPLEKDPDGRIYLRYDSIDLHFSNGERPRLVMRWKGRPVHEYYGTQPWFDGSMLNMVNLQGRIEVHLNREGAQSL